MGILILYFSTLMSLITLLFGLIKEFSLVSLLLRSTGMFIASFVLGNLLYSLWRQVSSKEDVEFLREVSSKNNLTETTNSVLSTTEEAVSMIKDRPQEVARVIDTLIEQ